MTAIQLASSLLKLNKHLNKYCLFLSHLDALRSKCSEFKLTRNSLSQKIKRDTHKTPTISSGPLKYPWDPSEQRDLPRIAVTGLVQKVSILVSFECC